MSQLDTSTSFFEFEMLFLPFDFRSDVSKYTIVDLAPVVGECSNAGLGTVHLEWTRTEPGACFLTLIRLSLTQVWVIEM